MASSRPAVTLRLTTQLREKIIRSGYTTVGDLSAIPTADLAKGTYLSLFSSYCLVRWSSRFLCTLLTRAVSSFCEHIELKLTTEQARELLDQLHPKGTY